VDEVSHPREVTRYVVIIQNNKYAILAAVVKEKGFRITIQVA
jgi:hypothetical protein